MPAVKTNDDVRGRWAVVPVKSFDWAKSRLEGVLSLTERRELARSLMRGVVNALLESACFERVLVVSHDEEALAFAVDLGAEAMREAGPPGLNEALSEVQEASKAQGATSLLVMFSDLPRVSIADIHALVRSSSRGKVVIGPDRHGEGTNALLLRPPNAIDFNFGPDSFRKHLEAAQRAGLETVVLRLAGIGYDVDLPADLEALPSVTLECL